MSSTKITEITEQLAKDYGDYIKVDWDNQMVKFRNIIEDTLIRLEEYQSIVAMVQNANAECMQQYFPKLENMKDGMTVLCKRIDALEHIVEVANINLCTLEAAVDKAEAEFGISDKLFGIPNPLTFFRKTQEPIVSSAVSIYKSPTIYNSDEYFEKE